MKRQWTSVVALCWVAGALAMNASSLPQGGGFSVQKSDTVKTEKKATQEESSKKEEKKGKETTDPPKPKETEYDKLVKKGGSFQQGMFDVRHIEDKWYFEIPTSALGRVFLSTTRFTSVPDGFPKYGGEAAGGDVFYFERYDDKTLFVRAFSQMKYAEQNSEIGQLLKDASIDPIIHRFTIIGTNPTNKKMLVDVTALLKGDNNIAGVSSSMKTLVKLGGQVSDRTYIDTIKVFSRNLSVHTLRTYSTSEKRSVALQSGFATLSMTTSFMMLPEKPMQPRLFDDRVGYFNTRFTTFSDNDGSKKRAFISRFRLVPKNVQAYQAGYLVEPVEPIVYYIDPKTPKQWVKYLIAGVNDWNKAFEAAGFKNAIIGKEWDKNSELDIDDVSLNVIRYLPSEQENAYGPRIVDPRSGEIIDSHVCWFHNVTNLLKKWYMVQCGPLDKRAQKMDFPDELMGELIRFVSSHEVGHSLGLRHNMIASSATPVEKLRNKHWVETHGHTASIMDYARFNYVAQPEDGISTKGLFPRINDYDCWAIKWGYQYRPEFKDPYTEEKVLRKETTQALRGNIRLQWVGDEGKGPDPRSQVEDLGDDSMKASDYGIANLKRVMTHIEKWTAQPNGETEYLNEVYRAVKSQFLRYMGHVQKNIYGRYFNNVPQLPAYQPVPKEKQQSAIDWMGRHVFEAPLWLYPASMTEKLGVQAEDEMIERSNSVLTYMLSSGIVYNILTQQYAQKEAYTAQEYLGDVFKAVWKPFTGDARRDNQRRQLENTYLLRLDKIIHPDDKDLAGLGGKASRSDVTLLAVQHLAAIEDFAKGQVASYTPNSIEALHYENVLRKVARTRNSFYNVKAQ